VATFPGVAGRVSANYSWFRLTDLAVSMLRRFEHNRVYRPHRELPATGAELQRPFENVFFRTSDGVELHGWFFPANPDSSRARFVILLCHGNAGNIGHRLELYRALLDAGANVFTFDYRGYGRSQGRPSEEGTYLDGQAACQWLRQKGFSSSRIVVYGESLGGGIASELCLREPMGGLILQGTFTSLPEIGADLYPWLPVRWISRIRYDTRNKLPRIKVPVLVMHSRGDGLIGFRHSEKNFAAANEPKQFCEIRGDHNDPTGDRTAFISGIEEFLKLVEKMNVGDEGEQSAR
jgi:fermentation-respiration switch protein FrsA (DUF1100 family)